MQRESSPQAPESVKKNAYIDDISASIWTTEEARELTEDIDKVLATGGFRVKKWITNAPSSNNEDSGEVVVGGEAQTEKVLETVWLPKEDKFSFRIKITFASTPPPLNDPSFTPLKLMKRIILSKLAGVFDLIGAGAAVLVKSKIPIQDLWQLGQR